MQSESWRTEKDDYNRFIYLCYFFKKVWKGSENITKRYGINSVTKHKFLFSVKKMHKIYFEKFANFSGVSSLVNLSSKHIEPYQNSLWLLFYEFLIGTERNFNIINLILLEKIALFSWKVLAIEKNYTDYK